MPIRGCGFESHRPHQTHHDPEKWQPVFGKDHAQSQSTWEANLVKAPHRKCGEVGSKPTPGTNHGTIAQSGEHPPRTREMRVRFPLAPPFRGQSWMTGDPCKIAALGSIPCGSTSLRSRTRAR